MTSFELIRSKNPGATDLLSVMSVFDRQGIPHWLLLKFSDNILSLQDRLMPLIDYSLISTRVDRKSYDMHHFVQLATRLWLDLSGLTQRYRSKAIATLWKAFPRKVKDSTTWNLCKELLPHVIEGCQHEFQDRGDLSNQTFLLFSLGTHLDKIGLHFQSIASLAQAISISTKFFGPLDRHTLWCQMALSNSLYPAGFLKASEEIAQRLMDLLEPKMQEAVDVSKTRTDSSNP